MNGSASKATTPIDDYLARIQPTQRAALENIRNTIHAAAPGAEECISYRLAAFRYRGKLLVAIGATEKHCAFYLMSSTIVPAHATELSKYDTSKGTIRFQPERPLPASLVKKLVKARIAENGAGSAQGPTRGQGRSQRSPRAARRPARPRTGPKRRGS